MNPLTKVRLINELNEREADLGVNESVSWHSEYKGSAWVFVGGFPYELTEGDIICVFSQYGEIVNINLVRDKKTGKSKGFCFVCYEDQRSTVLAVDNFNGIKIKGRTIRVDHVKDYRPPKDSDDIDDMTKRLREEGCGPKACSSSQSEEDEQYSVPVKKLKKDKKEKKKKKKEKKKKKKKEEKERGSRTLHSSSSPPPPPPPPLHPPAVRVKEERQEVTYDKYNQRDTPGGQREREAERHWKEMDRDRDEERRTNRESETDREGDRKRERDSYKKTEGDRDRKDRETNRETDRDRRRETDRDRKDREADRDRKRETDRDRKDRETDRDRRRETDRDRKDRETNRETDRDRRRETDRHQ
ncbi:hypothetical protein LDENG_00093910 [Lucifuga dentata]|nr:hypothetical protein LDENG_00093910 [Lucifuga dentata]